ncbi:unnamed protein product [Cuscuta europaea]|uniref:Replication protein A 70 kDa DNA-binding subunit B/D first OB fold domain-containing protein n=1 Tax=Cuscuta europaea TaxID=41803 RepID=A0A9P0YNX6_CUSEU|nr:unnamed protein product [Cuscuta europaea]
MAANTENTNENTRGNLYFVLKEVGHTKSTRALKVRVVRVFEMPPQSKGDQRMTVVFHDEEGDKIHAVIKRPFMPLYKSRLVENICYRIKNFLVLDNYYTYKTGHSPPLYFGILYT